MLSALFLAGNPHLWRNAFDKTFVPISQIHAEWEFSEIAAALSRPVSLGALAVKQSAGLSVCDVLERLHTEKPDILHIACHADQDVLILSNDDKIAHEIDEHTFGDLVFSLCKPRFVYLNGCHTAHIADKWGGRYKVHVIGNEGEISSTAASKGSAAFYTHFGHGQSVFSSLQFANTVMKGYPSNGEVSRVRLGTPTFAPDHFISAPFIKFPELIATAKRVGNKTFDVNVGVKNVPIETTALCFLSDDETIEEDYRQQHKSIISVPSPLELMKQIRVGGSFRFAIMGMTTDPKHAWCLQSSLSRVLHISNCKPDILSDLVANGEIPDEQDIADQVNEHLAKAGLAGLDRPS